MITCEVFQCLLAGFVLIHGCQRMNPYDFPFSATIRFTFVYFYGNISTTVGWIGMKFGRDIRGLVRMNH